jgi:hypothetical protein
VSDPDPRFLLGLSRIAPKIYRGTLEHQEHFRRFVFTPDRLLVIVPGEGGEVSRAICQSLRIEHYSGVVEELLFSPTGTKCFSAASKLATTLIRRRAMVPNDVLRLELDHDVEDVRVVMMGVGAEAADEPSA